MSQQQTTLADLLLGKTPDRTWEQRILNTRSPRKTNGKPSHPWAQAQILAVFEKIGDEKHQSEIYQLVRVSDPIHGLTVRVALSDLCHKGLLEETSLRMFKRVK